MSRKKHKTVRTKRKHRKKGNDICSELINQSDSIMPISAEITIFIMGIVSISFLIYQFYNIPEGTKKVFPVPVVLLALGMFLIGLICLSIRFSKFIKIKNY